MPDAAVASRPNARSARPSSAARVGILRIALDLSLGTSTVAHALAGNGTISDKTRRRVLAHAEKVGYVADRNARRMRARRTGVVGLLVPDVVLNYNDVVQHVFRHVAARGDEAQIALTEFDGDLEDRAITAMLEARADGILLKSCFARWADVPAGHALRRAVAAGVPLVLWGGRIEGVDLPAFQGPYAEQGRQVAAHLIGAGCRRLALVLPTPGSLGHPAHAAHAAGVRAAMAGAGLDPAGLRVACPESLDGSAADRGDGHDHFGNYIDQSVPRIGVENGRRLTAGLLDGSPANLAENCGGPAPSRFAGDGPPDGIIYQNDLMAVGGLRDLAGRGLSVPGDVRVAVLHHTVAGEMSPMTLTHSRIDPHDATAAALALLYGLIASAGDGSDPSDADPVAGPPADVTVGPHLIVGESSAARPIAPR